MFPFHITRLQRYIYKSSYILTTISSRKTCEKTTPTQDLTTNALPSKQITRPPMKPKTNPALLSKTKYFLHSHHLQPLRGRHFLIFKKSHLTNLDLHQPHKTLILMLFGDTLSNEISHSIDYVVLFLYSPLHSIPCNASPTSEARNLNKGHLV